MLVNHKINLKSLVLKGLQNDTANASAIRAIVSIYFGYFSTLLFQMFDNWHPCFLEPYKVLPDTSKSAFVVETIFSSRPV